MVWLSCVGVGRALSRRLLASGSSWALLRTLGRALRPDLVCVVGVVVLVCVCVCVCVWVLVLVLVLVLVSVLVVVVVVLVLVVFGFLFAVVVNAAADIVAAANQRSPKHVPSPKYDVAIVRKHYATPRPDSVMTAKQIHLSHPLPFSSPLLPLPSRLLSPPPAPPTPLCFGRTRNLIQRRRREDKMVTPTKQRRQRRATTAAAMSDSSNDDSSSAYLHSLVAVVVGSFVCSAEGLTRGTLSAGIAKHVRGSGGRGGGAGDVLMYCLP